MLWERGQIRNRNDGTNQTAKRIQLETLRPTAAEQTSLRINYLTVQNVQSRTVSLIPNFAFRSGPMASVNLNGNGDGRFGYTRQILRRYSRDWSRAIGRSGRRWQILTYLGSSWSWQGVWTWRLKINETKSSHITFNLRRGHCRPVHINQTAVPHAETVKYLELHFDKRLTWNETRDNETQAIRPQNSRIKLAHW